jgi:hypothetical protein
MRILFMLIVYRGLPRDECDEILTSRRFFHTGFYTAYMPSNEELSAVVVGDIVIVPGKSVEVTFSLP